MTPSDETIKAYLALPLKARQALAERANGIGWFAGQGHGGPVAEVHAGWPEWADFSWDTGPCAWIPASEAETARVWATVLDPADPLWVLDHNGMTVHAHTHLGVYAGNYDERLRQAAECCPVAEFAP